MGDVNGLDQDSGTPDEEMPVWALPQSREQGLVIARIQLFKWDNWSGWGLFVDTVELEEDQAQMGEGWPEASSCARSEGS